MKSLIVCGGWDGHEPEQMTAILREELEARKVKVEVETSLEVFEDPKKLKKYDVITPMWTMGDMKGEQAAGLSEAVKKGVGLAGIHGGMGDAFRNQLGYQWMVGGQFVSHPGGIKDYYVAVTKPAHPVMKGMPKRFKYHSEQYYQLVDPGNEVLATSRIDFEGRKITLPVVWVKPWGKGRVFYSALGHVAKEFETYPFVREMTVRGILWAGRGSLPAVNASKRASGPAAKTAKKTSGHL